MIRKSFAYSRKITSMHDLGNPGWGVTGWDGAIFAGVWLEDNQGISHMNYPVESRGELVLETGLDSLVPLFHTVLFPTSIVPVLTLRVTLSTKLILSNSKYLANSALSKLYS
jgi:hypothetical protein